MVVFHASIKVKPGTRDDFMKEIKEKNIIEFCRNQKGNIFYDLALSTTDEDEIIACDAWEDAESFAAHSADPEVGVDYAGICKKYLAGMVPHIFNNAELSK